jgi:hypothetical protein
VLADFAFHYAILYQLLSYHGTHEEHMEEDIQILVMCINVMRQNVMSN